MGTVADIALVTLRGMRRSIAWWSAGLAGLVILMVAVYPSIRDNPLVQQLGTDYPEVLKEFVSFGGEFDYASPAGYLGAELFSMIVPLLLVIAAVAAGARAIAGEEEAGTLDLLLAMPVSRTRVVVQKLLALAGEMVLLGAVLFVVLWPATAIADMDVPVSRLAAGCVDAVLLALVFGALAVLLGAATGRRGIALGVSAAIAVLAYVVNGLAPLVGAFDAIRPASPWYQYVASDPLRAGLDPLHALALVAIALALAVAAVPLLRRRDIGV